MINLLMLTCGTNASYHFSKIIKEKFNKDFKIIGTDINEPFLIPSIIYIDKFYKVPYSNDSKYYNNILEICKQEKIDFIIPTFDIDRILFYSENEDLKKINTKSISINKDILDIYKNKKNMNSFLKKNHLPIPKTYSLNELEDNTKYIIKPFQGCGSNGVECLNKNDILKKDKINNYLIQEVCSQPEITLECFYFEKKLSAIARERIDSKAGVCTKARIYNDETLKKIAYKFAKVLNCPLFFNLQFMKNNKNEYVITDVNLRLAGGMSLSYAAGWDEVSAIAKYILGKGKKEVFETLPDNISEQYIVRAYTDIITKKIEQIVAFDLDGTLLDSRKRHIIVLNDILKKYNILLDTSDLIKFKRNGKNNYQYLISKGINEEIAKKIQNEWILHIEDENYLNFDTLYTNTIKLLNEYSNSNKILITARKDKNLVLKQLSKFGIKEFFTNIYVVTPDSNVAEKKAQILKQTAATLMIGDTKSDYESAYNVNIKFRHINHGFHKKELIKRL